MGWLYFKAFSNRILIDALPNTKKGWKDAFSTTVDDFDFPSRGIPMIPT